MYTQKKHLLQSVYLKYARGCTLLPEKRQSQSNLLRQHDVLLCGYIKGYLEFTQLRMNNRTLLNTWIKLGENSA
jgi:hypothetical protein